MGLVAYDSPCELAGAVSPDLSSGVRCRVPPFVCQCPHSLRCILVWSGAVRRPLPSPPLPPRPYSPCSLVAKDVMHTEFGCLTLGSTLRDAIALLSQRRLAFEDSASVPQFPLVVRGYGPKPLFPLYSSYGIMFL
jgi:hypothetical protein